MPLFSPFQDINQTSSYIKSTRIYGACSFVLVILFCVFCSITQGQEKITETVRKYEKSELLRHAQWSVYAEYVDSGETVIAHNSDKSLCPASGLKGITTAAALECLGKEFRFETRIYYHGQLSNDGILEGNLYIVGGGDPTLGSDTVTGSLSLDDVMQSWVASVKKRGIVQIKGNVIADVSLFEKKSIPDFWPWGDIGNYYGAGSSALCIHDNLYFLYFRPGRRVGDVAEVLSTKPIIPGLTFKNHMRTGKAGSGDNGYIYCAPNQFVASLHGTVPAGKSEFAIKGSIPNPALFAAQYFTKMLKRNGIQVSGAAGCRNTPQRHHESKRIHTTYSPPLYQIIEITNKRSINLYAEQLLKMVAYKKTGVGSTEKGVKEIKSFVGSFDIDTDGFRIFDGSGLSRNNTVTTEIFSKLLSAMTKQKTFGLFYHSFSRAGDPNDIGYVKTFGKGTPVALNARMKTGYITGVRSHSGYIHTRSGKLVSFSLICNNFSAPLKNIDAIHEDVIVLIAEKH